LTQRRDVGKVFPASLMAVVARRVLSLGSVMLVAAASAVSGCGLTSAASEAKQDIVIAADLELSGVAADLGTAYDRALRLKIDQLNESGALDGREIRYQPKDNRSDKTLSLANITDFTNDPSVTAIVTGACSDCVQAANKTINQKRVPTISLSPASDVTTPITPYIFKVGPNAQDDAAAISAELGRSTAKKVGVLATDDEYGRDGQSAMENELDSATGPSLVAKAEFKPTDTDVSQAVAEVVASKPDALVVWAYADQAQRVAQSAKDAGFTGALFFDAAAAGDLFLGGSSGGVTSDTTLIFPQTMAIDDVIATTPAKAARKQWFRDYTSRYGSYSGVAAFAADAVDLIAAAVTRVGVNRDQIRSIIETSQVDGISGPIRLTPANHSGLMPQALTLLVARAGRWRLAS
jgi:branched-chain amino acid transport system substrate-binding protein